jgi:hypothetical protein
MIKDWLQLVEDWSFKRLVATSCNQAQDRKRPVLSGPGCGCPLFGVSGNRLRLRLPSKWPKNRTGLDL